MGYILNVWRVDFGRLLALPGSRDEKLLAALLPQLEGEDDERRLIWQEDQDAGDSDPEEFRPAAEVLRHILDGAAPPAEDRGGEPLFPTMHLRNEIRPIIHRQVGFEAEDLLNVRIIAL